MQSYFRKGCKPLEELLLTVWEHGYQTLACCKGHELPESYLKIGTFRIKRMTAEEYHTRQEGSWIKRPRGYVRAPEFTHPYIEFKELPPKEVTALREFLRKNIDIPGKANITFGDNSVGIAFHNQYDLTSDRIDNTECWKQILDVMEQYLEKTKTTWKEQVKQTTIKTDQKSLKKPTFPQRKKEESRELF